MKKILLLLLAIMPLLSSAQTVVLSDSFDTYTAGMPMAAQSPLWITWSGAPTEDANVDSTQSSSPPNSVYIIGNNGPTDLMLPFPANYTSGVYELTLKMFIVTAKGGYFNLQGSMTPGVDWMLEVYYGNAGTGNISAGGANAAVFNYNANAWNDVKVHVDLTNDLAEFYMNSVLIHSWQWSLGADGLGAPISWGGVNIYAAAIAPPGDAEFYVDDLVFSDLTVSAVDNGLSFSEATVYPNPSSGRFELAFFSNFTADATIQLTNVAGEIVMESSERIASGKNSYINDMTLPGGLYFLRVIADDKMITKKIVIENIAE